jgi:ABC-2 type transport system ATP-binding protein
VFLTSHVLEIVERLCTHVGIIVQGKLVEQGELATLRAGRSLEERFLEKVGSIDEMHQQLSWLDSSELTADSFTEVPADTEEHRP